MDSIMYSIMDGTKEGIIKPYLSNGLLRTRILGEPFYIYITHITCRVMQKSDNNLLRGQI